MLKRVFVVVISFFYVSVANVYACDFNDEDGLDVGLVLSGGGAKASTQVGALQILDELGIPVHCVAGTSMGAVVGAFYSAGYSADDIGHIMTDNDWGEIFRGSPLRRDKSFIEKEREETYFTGNVAGLKRGALKLPGGINSMQGLKSLFRHTLANVPLDVDFDDLEIPFRAIAADLKTGDTTAFEHGDLVEAILASMAVPGVFAPREIDGRFYVDGGIASTLPVKTAKEMGADIIIAIDVSNSPDEPVFDMSVAATAQQITTIVVWRSLQRDLSHLSNDDLLIRPNTNNISTSAYNQSEAGISDGRKETLNYKDALLEIKALAAPAQRNPKMVSQRSETSELRIVNNTIVDSDLIRNRVQASFEANEDTDLESRELRNLASFGGFGEVDMAFSGGDAVLTVNENALGRNLLKVGVNAANDFNGNSSYSVMARLTRKPLSRHGGDISLSAELGTNIGLSAELYQPLGAGGRYFVQPELFAVWGQYKFTLVDERLGDFWVRGYGARARVGRELGQWGIIALEGEVVDSKAEAIVTQIPDFETEKGQGASAGVYFAIDTLNRNDWPTSGQRLRVRGLRSFELGGERQESDSFEASWLGAYDVSGYGVLLNGRYGKIKNKQVDLVGANYFQLGGFRQLGDFNDDAIPLTKFSYASLEVFKRLNQSGKIFDLPLYVGGLAETAYFPLDLLAINESVHSYTGTLYLGADTPIGPAFFGAAYGSSNSLKVFFKFGRTF